MVEGGWPVLQRLRFTFIILRSFFLFPFLSVFSSLPSFFSILSRGLWAIRQRGRSFAFLLRIAAPMAPANFELWGDGRTVLLHPKIEKENMKEEMQYTPLNKDLLHYDVLQEALLHTLSISIMARLPCQCGCCLPGNVFRKRSSCGRYVTFLLTHPSPGAGPAQHTYFWPSY